MILVKASDENSYPAQRRAAERILEWWRAGGWRPRSSELQVDETTGFIVLTLDNEPYPVTVGTVEIQVNRLGCYRVWQRDSGWTDWGMA